MDEITPCWINTTRPQACPDGNECNSKECKLNHPSSNCMLGNLCMNPNCQDRHVDLSESSDQTTASGSTNVEQKDIERRPQYPMPKTERVSTRSERELKRCKHDRKCYKPKCRFDHPNNWCLYGSNCKALKCNNRHPRKRKPRRRNANRKAIQTTTPTTDSGAKYDSDQSETCSENEETIVDVDTYHPNTEYDSGNMNQIQKMDPTLQANCEYRAVPNAQTNIGYETKISGQQTNSDEMNQRKRSDSDLKTGANPKPIPKSVTQSIAQKQSMEASPKASVVTTTHLDVNSLFQDASKECMELIKEHSAQLELIEKTIRKESKQNSLKEEEHKKAIESKITELRLQLVNAFYAFHQSDSFQDGEIRKKRELFRLKARLPALAKRRDIENALSSNQFIVVKGETGSGKSTQIVQYIADLPDNQKKMVICTQPRKIAAISLANRVAMEYEGGNQAKVGKYVGYETGGRSCVTYSTRINFVTESVLLNQINNAEENGRNLFGNCCAVIIDEAHSRNVTTDVLLGIFKAKAKLWPDLKIIVTSATIDTSLFSTYLFNCPVIEIPGRLFPVEVIYNHSDITNERMVEAAVVKALEISEESAEEGDILCFLTGQNEVESANQWCATLAEQNARLKNKIVVYSLHGKQIPDEQQEVFKPQPKGIRKIIFTTNVAETSITIDGIKFVIDSGIAKSRVYDPKRNVTALKELDISKGAAEQRKGRAGRTAPGICYRLYTEEKFNNMENSEKAEIFCRPLTVSIAILKSMKTDPFRFDWIEKPDPLSLQDAWDDLLLIGGLDDTGDLTDLGRLIAELQADPGIALMLIYGCQQGLGVTATILAGIISVSNIIFWRGQDAESRKIADEKKNALAKDDGDIVTMYHIYMEWLRLKELEDTRKRKTDQEREISPSQWCVKNYINNKALNMAMSTAKEIRYSLSNSALNVWPLHQDQNVQPTNEQLLKLITQAFVMNVARLANNRYIVLKTNTETVVHPGSVLKGKSPESLPKAVIFQTIHHTSQIFCTQLTPVNLKWIKEENSKLYKFYKEKAANCSIFQAKVDQVPRDILLSIVGTSRHLVRSLNTELYAYVQINLDDNILMAWCRKADVDHVQRQLEKKVQLKKRELEMEMQEDAVIGSTRLVWGLGGQGKCLVFKDQFMNIDIHKIPSYFSITDVRELVTEMIEDQPNEAIVKIIFLKNKSDAESKSVRVMLNSPETASALLKTSQKSPDNFQYDAVLTDRATAFREDTAWLIVTFALSSSNKSAILIYSSAKHARMVLDNKPANLSTLQLSKNLKQNEVTDFFCSPSVDDDPSLCNKWVLYANRLSPYTDEQNIQDELQKANCYLPNYVKINRQKIEFPDDKELERQAELSGLIPFRHRVVKCIIKKDEKRVKTTFRLQYESAIDVQLSRQLIPKMFCSQPVRVVTEYCGEIRLDKDIWAFHKAKVQAILKNESDKLLNRSVKEAPSDLYVWIRYTVSKKNHLAYFRKRISDALEYTFYKNADKKLLFSRYGMELVLNAIKGAEIHLHITYHSHTIRIYGDEEPRKDAVRFLDRIVEELKTINLDVPLIIRRDSVAIVTKNLPRYREIIKGMKKLDISFNRLIATGSTSDIDQLKQLVKNYLVDRKNQLKNQDCAICFDILENPVYFKLCVHKCCLECVKAMIGQQQLKIPIMCPAENCNEPLCLQDILAIATDKELENIRELAINKLVREQSDKYQQCFKPGCSQYLPIASKKILTNLEEKVLGGYVVTCDQCCVSYCVPCSTKLETTVERHPGQTCIQRQNDHETDVEKNIRLHRLYILDNFCTLKCPRCKQVFLDFEQCCAITCGNGTCNAKFCYFCLTDCGTDAHAHVIKCEHNPSPGQLFLQSPHSASTVHCKQRHKKIVEYLLSKCKDSELRRAIFNAIRQDLQDINITINPSEIGLISQTPNYSPITSNAYTASNSVLPMRRNPEPLQVRANQLPGNHMNLATNVRAGLPEQRPINQGAIPRPVDRFVNVDRIHDMHPIQQQNQLHNIQALHGLPNRPPNPDGNMRNEQPKRKTKKCIIL